MKHKEVITLLVVVVVLMLVGIFAGIYFLGGKGALTTTGTTPVTGGTPSVPSAAGGCFQNPSLVLSWADSGTRSTTLSPTINYRFNGASATTTSPTSTGTVDTLASLVNYVSVINRGTQIGCGANNPGTWYMNKFANASLTQYSDNGLTALTAYSINETKKSAGASSNWRYHMVGTDKASTGKQLIVIELSSPANVSSLSMSGAQEVAVPSGYSSQLTNGFKKAFLVPSLDGNVVADYNVGVNSVSGTVVAGVVYTTIYSVEPFVDIDGTFSDSGLAYNSGNTLKYHDVQTKNFAIA